MKKIWVFTLLIIIANFISAQQVTNYKAIASFSHFENSNDNTVYASSNIAGTLTLCKIDLYLDQLQRLLGKNKCYALNLTIYTEWGTEVHLMFFIENIKKLDDVYVLTAYGGSIDNANIIRQSLLLSSTALCWAGIGQSNWYIFRNKINSYEFNNLFNF